MFESRAKTSLQHSPMTAVKTAAIFLLLASLLGCQGLSAGKGSTQTPSTSGDLGLSKSSITFGNVVLGKTATQTITATNSGTASLTVSSAKSSSPQFSVTAPAVPLTIAAGQSANLSVAFTPSAASASTATISFASDASDSSLSLSLTGTGITAGQLSASPASISFVNIEVGNTETQSAAVTNTGGASVTISQATATGPGFSITGFTPLTLPAGQSTTVNVVFAPQSAGAVSGNVALSSNASNTTLNLPLSGAALAPGSLTAQPTSISFGSIQVGNSQQQSATLTNTGGSSVTISQASAAGAGFSVNSSSFPLTLAAGQSTTLTITFAPHSSGSPTGSATISSNAPNPTLTIPLSGTAVSPGGLSTTPPSISFTSEQVGNSESQSEVLQNTGGSDVTISQVGVTGAGFSETGLTAPVTLTPGQSFTFSAVFAPQTSGGAGGSISITSNGSNPSLSIPLSGTATPAGQLGVSPTTMNIGNVVVGSSGQSTGSISATGASVTVSSADSSNSEFKFSGLSLPVTIAAGHSAGFTVTFTPQSTGTANATLTFTSNASNSPTTESLTGVGSPTPHSVALSWTASTSPNISGYNVYRGSVSGGPYTKINSTLNSGTTYTDSSVTNGQTYYYVTTAVNSSNEESSYSNQASAAVPQ